jgi:DNA polymerase III epsilon subunit-like protein
LCREFGPEKDGRPNIFNRFYSVDLLSIMFCLFENNKEVNSLSADNLIRGHMGYAKGVAHDAMSDVIMTAEVFCRTQHHLRRFASGLTFKNSLRAIK